MYQDHPWSSILLSLQQFCQLTYVGVFEVLEETDLTNGSARSSLENAESVVVHLLANRHHVNELPHLLML